MPNTTIVAPFPVDVPRVMRKGLAYREANAPGNADALNLAPESPERRARGDLGNSIMPGFASRPSVESPGLPFKLKGK